MAARTTIYVHTQPNAVLIVVDSEFPHSLHQAASGTLVPKLLAAAAIIMCLTDFQRALERFRIHIAMHQNFA